MAKRSPAAEAYEAHKERAAGRQASQSAAGRDIGDIPKVADARRKSRCRRSFKLFCETYFPEVFNKPWSPDHLKVIKKIELAVLRGELFAVAMPRGSGKTSLCEVAVIWAVLYGHRVFVVLIGATQTAAQESLDSIKTEIETNELLGADFPEVCYPVQQLDGINQRAAGQLCKGQRTAIEWTNEKVVLPTVKGSKASGAVVRVAGLTGGIRGMKHKTRDGRSIRPDLVLIDDPQTDESAHSPTQCDTRHRLLMGAVLGLAGPGKQIAGLMPCTVVREGDLADRILDVEKHPEWHGERTKLMYEMPKDTALWDEYAEVLKASMRRGEDMSEATEFYEVRRAKMDAGAVAAWEHRFDAEREASAIQHAMNLLITRGEEAFWAEYQNQPLKPDDSPDLLTADQIASKTNGHARRRAPIWAEHLTAFIDVQGDVLFYVVTAWGKNFTGAIVDYGSEPDQGVPYFTIRKLRKGLKRAAPKGSGMEAAIYAGLERLVERLMLTAWERDDGAPMHIERMGIDSAWGKTQSLVFQFCRQSTHSRVLIPTRGQFYGASSMPFNEYRAKAGDRIGHHWRVPSVTNRAITRRLDYDTNYWKSFLHERLRVGMGDPGCLSLYGDDPQRHRMLADHLLSERPYRVTGRGQVVDEWKGQPGLENHLFDGATGCCVLGSMLGCELAGVANAPKKRRVRLSEKQRARR